MRAAKKPDGRVQNPRSEDSTDAKQSVGQHTAETSDALTRADNIPGGDGRNTPGGDGQNNPYLSEEGKSATQQTAYGQKNPRGGKVIPDNPVRYGQNNPRGGQTERGRRGLSSSPITVEMGSDDPLGGVPGAHLPTVHEQFSGLLRVWV